MTKYRQVRKIKAKKKLSKWDQLALIYMKEPTIAQAMAFQKEWMGRKAGKNIVLKPRNHGITYFNNAVLKAGSVGKSDKKFKGEIYKDDVSNIS